MRNRERLLAAALLLGFATTASAQSVGRMVESDLRNAVKDMVSIWLSPFDSRGRDWMITGGVLASSAAVSLIDDDVDRMMVRNENWSGWSVLKELREGGAAFTGKTVVPVAGVAYVFALATNNEKIRDGVFGCVASYVSGSLLRNYVIYKIVGRQRPDSSRRGPYVPPPADNDDQYDFAFGDKGWGMHSMPAGHVANVAACASYLTNRFHMGYVEPVLWILTAGVGIGRTVDRRHWMSDNVVGTALGYAIGREIAHRALSRANDGQRPSSMTGSLQRGMYLTPGRGGLTLGWQTTF
jgi:membrane-associated phospholipid phosphatase